MPLFHGIALADKKYYEKVYCENKMENNGEKLAKFFLKSSIPAPKWWGQNNHLEKSYPKNVGSTILQFLNCSEWHRY